MSEAGAAFDDHILVAFYIAVEEADAGTVVYAGFILLLAFGCLRWADMQRSCAVGLSKDTLFGECWRSKKKLGWMPWAAPRRDWHGHDWAAPFFQTLSKFIDFKTVIFCCQPRHLEAFNVFRSLLRNVSGIRDVRA